MLHRVLQGDARVVLPTLRAASVHTVVTSPPYWKMRDYGMPGQIGLEDTPELYAAALVAVFRQVRRILRPDGTVWLNLGDCYNAGGRLTHGSRIGCKQQRNRASATLADHVRPTAPGLKKKDLVGIPWLVAFALRADGWYLRGDIIWHKPNPMPESVKDRPTKAHEYIFLLFKSEDYYYDAEAVREPCVKTGTPAHLTGGRGKRAGSRGGLRGTAWRDTRNRRSVWTVPTRGTDLEHYATYPARLVEPCILAGCPPGGQVLDPFAGSGTTGEIARALGRGFTGIELNPSYIGLRAPVAA